MNENEDVAFIPAQVLADEVQAGHTSATRIVRTYLDRIGKYDRKYRAYVEAYSEPALLAANAADLALRSGHRVSPYHGIPVALKDLIEIEGRVTAAGSEAWAGRRSTRTATVVRKLVQAGLIILGKTHAVEFALGGWGTNQRVGTPWNPWDAVAHRVPGGSSSGSAVAVAAGLAPWAIGTDTGGSIRMPAGFCGLTGLMPTAGRISTYGVVRLSRTMDTVGPITRTVEDAARLYDLLKGADPLDPRTRIPPDDNPMTTLKKGVKGLRLARMPDAEREGVAPAVLDAYDRAVDALGKAGAEVETVTLPRHFLDYFQSNACIVSAEAYAEFSAIAEDPTMPLDDVVRARILGGARFSARDYLLALHEREEASTEFSSALADFDALLTPTTADTAVLIDQIDPDVQPSRFTRVANYLNLCALSVPNGFDEKGLPTSLQIICPAFRESTALRIGWAYQNLAGWHRRTPPACNL